MIYPTFKRIAAAMTLLILLAARPAPAAILDDLLQDLRGPDDVKRSLARQFIPRHGIAAVPKLIPLLFQEDATVSWAANNTLLDIANDAGVPGREADREAIAQALLEALAATDTQEHQFTLLRMLPIAVPDGVDVGAIATLLHRDNTKERARLALQEMNTAESRAALRGALPVADPDFACALMDALDKTGDLDAAPLVRGKLAAGTPAEQAAAARYLARTGDIALAETLLELGRDIDINHRFTAEDATLRLADTLARQGGTWEGAMALYRAVLGQSENPVIRGGALAGLGRYGDETALDTILAAWSADDAGLLEAPAMAAIESLQDPAVPKLLLAAYPEQAPAIRARLLGIMGRTHDPRYLPAFGGADDIDPLVRVDALQQSGLTEAIPLIEALGVSGDPAIAGRASEAMAAMAGTFRDRGDRAGAGRAYLALYRIAGDDGARAEALEGIKAYPVAEAYDELKAALGGAELLNLPVQVLTGMARVLGEAGRADESNLLKTALLDRATDTAAVQQLIQLGPAEGSHEDFARQLGFVNQWQVAAPFPLADAPDNGGPVLADGAVDLAAQYESAGKNVAWAPMAGGGAMAVVNLAHLGLDNVRAFAYVTINVPEAQEATLRIGSDDGVRAWVNGEKVHENITDRGTALDNDLVPINLKAGDNALLLEIIQYAGGWGFCARLTQPDGLPLTFEQK